MTTEDNESAVIPEVLRQNIETLEELNQRFVSVLQNKKKINPSLNGPGQDLMVKASHAYWSNFMENPANLMEKQISYWGKTLEYFVEAQHAFTQGQFQIPQADGKPDRRFKHEMWSLNPYFNFVKEHYLRTADLINSAISELDGMEPKEKRRLEFFTRQIVDMMSPTNFLATNPDALERAMETQGQSLIDGMQNLIADLEANEGELVVRLADETAFEVGGNIATAKGSVVFRNEMFELIQYAPTTETVHETPIIMFPPWINKYYILDLKEQNSLIRWVVDQGYTLFVVSWVNPDASYADIGMEEYMGSSDKTFILSESGHIAGIVNPPSKKKYGHYTLDDIGLDADDWKESASFNEGSWWPRWNDWISRLSGYQVPARIPGTGSFKVICEAPGTYVLRRSHV